MPLTESKKQILVVGEEKGALLASAADHQRDVGGGRRSARLGGVLRQVAAIDDRAELVAVEQRPTRSADRARRWRDQ